MQSNTPIVRDTHLLVDAGQLLVFGHVEAFGSLEASAACCDASITDVTLILQARTGEFILFTLSC